MIKQFFTSIIFFGIFYGSLLSQQTTIDSLKSLLPEASESAKIDIYNGLSSDYYKSRDKTKSINYAKKALRLSQELQLNRKEAEAYRNIAKGYILSQDYETSVDYFYLALQIYDELKDDEEIGKIYNNIGGLYSKLKHYDKAIYFYQKSIDKRKIMADKKPLALTLINLGTVYYNMNNFDKALNFYKSALEIYEKTGIKEDIALIYKTISQLYYKWGKYSMALDYAIEELTLREELKDPEKTSANLSMIGKIYFDWRNFEKSIEYYEKSLKIAREIKDSMKIASSLSNIGGIFLDWGKNKKALEYFKNSLTATNAMINSNKLGKRSLYQAKQGNATVLNNIGRTYLELKNFDLAVQFCNRSLALKEELGNKEKTIYPLTSLGEIFLKKRNYTEADNYARRSLEIAKESKKNALLKDAYKLLYQIHAAANDPALALKYHVKYTEVKDSIISAETKRAIEEISIKYETEKQAKENEQRARDNEKLNNENIMQRTYFIFTSGLILIILIIIYNRYRSKRKANILLSEKNTKIVEQHQRLEKLYKKLAENEEKLREANITKDKFFSIIAHDLKNPLQALLLSSDLLVRFQQQFDEKELEKKYFYIRKTARHMSELLESLLQWARTQTGRIEFNPGKIDLSELMLDNINLLYTNANKKNIRIENSVKEETFAYADRNMILTVIRNLLTNAIKFSNPGGYIKTSVVKNGEKLEFLVEDDGVGLSEEDLSKLFRIDAHHTTLGTNEEKGTGLGLILCKEFVEKNSGTINVTSQKGRGSVFSFTLPCYTD